MSFKEKEGLPVLTTLPTAVLILVLKGYTRETETIP